MNETDRQRAIRTRLSRMRSLQPGFIATGFRSLDEALGGGLPRGGIVELFGPPSAGKTTLALQAAACSQATGLNVAWIDADRCFDPAYASSLGVLTERLTVAQPESAEQAMEIARRLAESAAIDLIIVDSAAALVPMLELAAEIGHGGPGLQARVLASGLRKLRTALARSGTAALFLNQMRRQGAGHAGRETTAGGPPLRLLACVRIALRPSGVARAEFRLIKNRLASAFAHGELAWSEGAGFSKTP